jgi:hypothetical protein
VSKRFKKVVFSIIGQFGDFLDFLECSVGHHLGTTPSLFFLSIFKCFLPYAATWSNGIPAEEQLREGVGYRALTQAALFSLLSKFMGCRRSRTSSMLFPSWLHFCFPLCSYPE